MEAASFLHDHTESRTLGDSHSCTGNTDVEGRPRLFPVESLVCGSFGVSIPGALYPAQACTGPFETNHVSEVPPE